MQPQKPTWQSTCTHHERSSDQVAQFIVSLAKAYQSVADKTVCFLHGMGGQPASLYESLRNSQSADVLWTGSVMPKWLSAVLWFAPSYAGVLRIKDSTQIASLFSQICEQSMAGIYMFDVLNESNMAQIARTRANDLQSAVEADPTHLIYIVDEDSNATEDKVTEILKIGMHCPTPLADVARTQFG
jgi:hypothetical protein